MGSHKCVRSVKYRSGVLFHKRDIFFCQRVGVICPTVWIVNTSLNFFFFWQNNLTNCYAKVKYTKLETITCLFYKSNLCRGSGITCIKNCISTLLYGVSPNPFKRVDIYMYDVSNTYDTHTIRNGNGPGLGRVFSYPNPLRRSCPAHATSWANLWPNKKKKKFA